jgi:hypothetical protein
MAPHAAAQVIATRIMSEGHKDNEVLVCVQLNNYKL